MLDLLTLYDYIIVAFILFFSCIGLVRGFWVQLFSAFVWSMGLVFFYLFSSDIEHGFLSQYMTEDVAHWFCLIGVFVGCCVVNFIARFLLNSIFKINPFTLFNKIGGFFLGFFASSLMLLLIVYAFNTAKTGVQESTPWKNSVVLHYLTPVLSSFKDNHNDSSLVITGKNASDTELPSVVNAEFMD